MTDNQIEPVPGNAPDVFGNVQDSPEAPPFSVGVALREARMRLGLSVAEISDRIKFAPRQIETLEADDFALLPEAAFVRGFVRSYARALQLDPAPLLAALPHAPQQSMPQEAQALVEVPFSVEQAARKPNIIWLAAALAVVVILALFAWMLGRTPDAPQTMVEPVALPAPSQVPQAPVQATDAASHVAVAEPVPVAPSRPASVRFVFDKQAWVEVADKDGKILLSQAGPSGTEKSLEGVPPFLVSIGYASGVKLFYKGKPVDLKPYTKLELARLTLE